MSGAEQSALFVEIPEQAASGIRAQHTDPANSDAALTSDGYGWLTGLLPAPTPPRCETCGAVMVLPASAPVLWTCPTCYPREAR